ncbi:hypothetical protein [Nostoc sp. NMS4]|uniref:hypothetical protein n=1 Tax=Nostoc sp. NMS4 TaxID=2815390 RepID=UPI0025F96C0D|nr:hypothetical protein [Nostoc sp. NMS4]MBN3925753.1 hypothetical protein [Nostoc sp. NMS4]
MPNRKGNPQNFDNPPSKELTENVTFRATKEMKEEIQKQDNPAQFCREAVQKALDEKKEGNK